VVHHLPGKVGGVEHGEAARQLGGAHPSRQLEQRQRVPACLGDDAVTDSLVQAARYDRRQQGAGVLRGESREHQVRQAREQSIVGDFAHGEHDRHRLGLQPPGHEPQDLARGSVEPLRVVDQAQQRPVVGDLRQQAQRGQRNQETVRGVARGQAEGHPQGGSLRLGERVELDQHRGAQLVEGRVRQLHLGLDACELGHSKSGRLTSGVPQECCLPNAGFTSDDECRALAPADVRQQPVQHFTFSGTATERRGAWT
jgi:hypothetical protein